MKPQSETHSRGPRRWRLATAGAVLGLIPLTAVATAQPAAADASNRLAVEAMAAPPARTPIHHVVVIIGENHSFDNVFGTYLPKPGNSVDNLVSQGIVTTKGTLGPDASKATQYTATDTSTTPGRYSITPPLDKPYSSLPQPNTTYVNSACDGQQPTNSPDSRFPADLPNGPYQITHYVPFFEPHSSSACQTGAYVGDPLHRFYQMWQQVNKGNNRLWTWVHQTAGDGNGTAQPTDQGAVEMGYYNMAAGDAPAFAFIGNHYAMSDNYHQAIMGGTGANHIAIGDANVAVYRNSNGQLATPPAPQIENPNPMPGTNNYYSQDGYSGGSYTECADPKAPGVASIDSYLAALTYTPYRNGDCTPGAYYLLNNYNPGYNPNGTPANLAKNPYTVPPQTFPTIADDLQSHHLSWGYFGQGWNNGKPTSGYCGICDCCR